jgi:2,4-dichlorophenol 6-monooxygenase
MRQNMAALQHDDAASATQRAALREAINSTHYVYNTHGVEMNQRYSSDAIAGDGSPEPAWLRDPELYHQASSRPGAPLPHAWISLNKRTVSTHDLCGGGRFVLLTGNTGHPWRQTAEKVSAELGVMVTVELIGPGQPAEDPFGEFADIRETAESGALLVRPDRVIGWRCHQYDDAAADGLRHALSQILGLPSASRQVDGTAASSVVPA